MDIQQLAIGIVTRNRWSELMATITAIRNGPLKKCDIYVIDDCSDVGCPEFILQQTKFVRHDVRKGYIVGRNALAHLITQPYYLSLDDDSMVVQGNLELALDYLEAKKNVITLSLPIRYPNGQWQSPSLYSEPYSTKAFIGCGHIHRVVLFKQLGGYRPELIHQGEELDFGARALMMGFEIHHYPKVEVLHRETSVARDRDRILYYESRNKVLWCEWYVPVASKGLWRFRTALGRLSRFLRTRRFSVLKGYFEGLSTARKLRRGFVMPLSYEAHSFWRKLPTA